MNKLMMSILAIGMTVFSGACVKTVQAKPPVESLSKPNIVVVVADDMGWGDSGTYGHELIKTPK